MTRVYIPQDSTALSVGADDVAQRLSDVHHDVEIIRNGSRGLFWLEPMLEVEISDVRMAYGPVTVNDVDALLAQGMLQGNQQHALALGKTEDIPYLQSQHRLTFSRAGIIRPDSLEDYRRMGGYQGLEKALQLSPQECVNELKVAGLRGRGGAAFPTAIKWQTVLDTNAAQKYVVCNADEGDSGTFADRLLMEADPFALLEGMTIAGFVTGASVGFIYVREEYPHALMRLREAIDIARENNLLGKNILSIDYDFDIQLREGAKSYVCGEETAMLESMEGKRGVVRVKPPLPAHKGLFGHPTVINNVLTFAAVPTIFARGGGYYADFGIRRSVGTMPFQLAGNLRQPGLVEVPFGVTVRQLLYDFGGGSRSGRPLRAVQIGGPLGSYLPPSQWDTEMDYEALSAIRAVLGHGGLVAFDDTVDMLQQARFSMEFCAYESCGKCTPCRIGSVRGVEIIDRISSGENIEDNVQLLRSLCDTMEMGSLCAMGGMTPYPVRSALEQFGEDFVEQRA